MHRIKTPLESEHFLSCLSRCHTAGETASEMRTIL